MNIKMEAQVILDLGDGLEKIKLTEFEARQLYNQLKELFDPKVFWIESPTPYQPYIDPHKPYNPFSPWTVTYRTTTGENTNE